MKRLLLFLVLVSLCITVVIGCGTPAATPAAPATTAAPATAAQTTSTVIKPATTPTVVVPGTAPPPTTAKPTSALKPIYGGKLVYIEPTSPSTPNGLPGASRGSHISMQVSLEAFISSLIDGTLTPKLSDNWEVNTDPKNASLTFHLRKGVKFHDGTSWNAQAAKWNMEQYVAGGFRTAIRYFTAYNIIDDYTLQFPMTMWRNTIVPAFYTFNAVSPSTYQSKGADWMRWNVVGTGPFKQVQYNPDQSYIGVRFDDYWDTGKPYLHQVEYNFVAEEMTRTALWKTGVGDIMNLAKNGRVASELKAAGTKIVTQSAATLALLPDSANPTSPWANIKVRQAAEYAIDKEAIAKAFGFGFSQPAYQWPAKTNPAYNPALAERKFDPAKAKQLLAEAGFPNGFKTKILCQNTVNRDIPVALQANLNAVGIQTDLDFPDAAKYTSYVQGTWENAMLLTGIGIGSYPNQSLTSFAEPRVMYKSNANPPNWVPLYNKTMMTPTPDAKVMQEWVKAIYDEVMMIPFLYEFDMIAIRDNVHDTRIGELQAATSWDVANTWKSK